MNPHDLIKIASFLATTGVASSLGRPRQADLRRAISTLYYALFHALAHCCADTLAGTKRRGRNRPRWRQIYRSLEHRQARNRLNNREEMQNFPSAMQDFARRFVALQALRHAADYDPAATFDRPGVTQLVAEAERHISGLENAAPADRRDFAIYVLFRDR